MASVIDAALSTVKLIIDSKSIQIQTQLDFNVGQVLGDFNSLQQVVGNLISNTVKFTPNGGRVEISLKQVGIYAQIKIADTGKGINPNFLPYIFEHLRQEDSTTTRKFGGLGLGLAIVHHLVELHNGTVTVNF